MLVILVLIMIVLPIEDLPPPKPQLPKMKKGSKSRTDGDGEANRQRLETVATNYVAENALNVIKSSDPIAAKAREAAVKKLTNRRYRDKPDYGCSPKYLNKVRIEVEEEKRVLRELLEERKLAEIAKTKGNSGKRETVKVSEEQRLELLNSLKRRWAVVNKKFQSILSAQTLIKLREKEKLEELLKQIEKKGGVIFCVLPIS